MRDRCPHVAALVSALALAATGESLAQIPLKVGEVRPYNAETPHPYPLGDETRPVVWTDNVVSPGATFLRVHFTGLHLAPGDYLTISDPAEAELWTYSGRGPHGHGDVWSFAVTGDTAVIRLRAGRAQAHGYRIDAVGHGTGRLEGTPEIVCGTDGRKDVACYIKRLRGFEEAQSPVARLLFRSGGFLFVCTGWLVRGARDDLLMTNNHCLDDQREVESLEASFNLQHTRCGGTVLAAVSRYAGGTLVRTNAFRRHGMRDGLDYTLLTLQGHPEAAWGELIPSRRALAVGDLIWFIQHPGGRPKQAGVFEDAEQTVRCKLDAVDQSARSVTPHSLAFFSCDSAFGSSGSPIVDAATGHAIALHHSGGVLDGTCVNLASQMASICDDAGGLIDCAED